MMRNLLARLYDTLGNHRTQGTAAKKRQCHPLAESLEGRVTPSTSSVLLPAFYQDLLQRAPDYPAATSYANQLDSGAQSSQVAYQIETASTQEYFKDLVQSYFTRYLHRQGSNTEVLSYVNNYLLAGKTD